MIDTAMCARQNILYTAESFICGDVLVITLFQLFMNKGSVIKAISCPQILNLSALKLKGCPLGNKGSCSDGSVIDFWVECFFALSLIVLTLILLAFCRHLLDASVLPCSLYMVARAICALINSGAAVTSSLNNFSAAFKSPWCCKIKPNVSRADRLLGSSNKSFSHSFLA